MDLTAYGFTQGFQFYGFDFSQTVDFLITFNGDDVNGVGAASATTDCAEAAEGCNDGYWDCGDGQCIPESYVCDGSSEFCNASWGPDCANGADEGLEFCGYEDECEEEEPEGCGDDEFTCNDGSCIPASWECDVYWCDCPGEACEDEADCGDDGGDDGCVDCQGQDCTGYENWVGDGYCDDGAWGMYFNCDEFNCDEGDCDCSGRSTASANVLSTNADVNDKMHAGAINKYKKSVKAFNNDAYKVLNAAEASVMINVLTGEVTYSDDANNGNRTVSYTIDVSCDTCLSGGPWSGSWTDIPQSDFLIYGFDAGANVCGSVTGVSTLYGNTESSEAACAEAGGEVEECEFFDCSGAEACGVEGYVGDGYCDDGSWGYYFNCAEFDCDGGDCTVECWDGSSACSGDTECPEEPQCGENDVNSDGQVNVTDIVFVVSVILGTNQTDPDECTDVNGDGQINVTDIVTIVNAILGGSARVDDATDATITIAGNLLSVDGNGFIQGIQLTLTHEGSININLENEYVADYRTIGNTTTLVVVTDGSHSLTDVATISGSYEITDAIVVNSQDEVQTQQVLEVAGFELKAAYPNPFNPVTSLDLVVPEAGFVSVKVYNVMGQEVATLTEGMMQATSGYTLTWDASNMSSGVYLVRAEGVGSVATQKLMLLK